ncbi:MAG TPA: KH domain-containing protein [Candidatus Paceibacterota bacterium]|nr:KH domain-containing protein [Candidatus Paceibacterota bacterium]
MNLLSQRLFEVMSVDRDRDFVEYIIKAIVNNPDAVQVTRTVDELGVLLSVKVSREDMGLLIGRSGTTAKAVRTLARIVGMRNNARVNLRIEEPEGGRMTPAADGGKSKTVEDVMEGFDM